MKLAIGTAQKVAKQTKKPTRFQIESGTRGASVGSTYEQRSSNWPTFSWSPSEDHIIRLDDKQAAEAELARVQSYAANARLREVD